MTSPAEASRAYQRAMDSLKAVQADEGGEMTEFEIAELKRLRSIGKSKVAKWLISVDISPREALTFFLLGLLLAAGVMAGLYLEIWWIADHANKAL